MELKVMAAHEAGGPMWMPLLGSWPVAFGCVRTVRYAHLERSCIAGVSRRNNPPQEKFPLGRAWWFCTRLAAPCPGPLPGALNLRSLPGTDSEVAACALLPLVNTGHLLGAGKHLRASTA